MNRTRTDRLLSRISMLEARIRVQQIHLDRMWRTDDGEYVVQWDTVWIPTPGVWANGDPVNATEVTLVGRIRDRWTFDEHVQGYTGPIYSTLEAAEEAAGLCSNKSGTGGGSGQR